MHFSKLHLKKKESNANNECESVKTADNTVPSGLSFSIHFSNKIRLEPEKNTAMELSIHI